MAESIINYSDLIKDDGGFVKLEKELDALGTRLEAKAKSWKESLSFVDVTETGKIKDLEKEILKLKEASKNLADQKKLLNSAKKKEIDLSKDELIALQKERAEMAKNRNEAKLIAQIKSSQKGSIEQLRAKLGLVTIAWAKLSEEERNNSERGERLIESKKQITEELKREEKATGDARRNVGNYAESVKEAIREMRLEKEALESKNKSLRDEQNLLEESSAEYRVYQKEIDKTETEINNLNNELNEGSVAQDKLGQSTKTSTGFLTKMLVAVGGLTLLKNGFNLVSEFETQIADLSAVTGQTGKDLDFLKDKSIDFSKKFGVSASSIAEAFKLAGSARPELLKNGQAMADLTEKAIILSKASGDDVPTSIANLTGTLNAFELPASKAGEVMDTLANASQLGAVEIPYLTEAFTKFGAVASTAGVGIGESASALEILGEKIPDASTAGTNMKNILIKLQIEAGKQGRSFRGLSEELQMLKPKLKDVTFLSKMFGAENINGAQILIKNSERIQELSKQYDKQNTAMEMYITKSKTVGEALNRMKESFNAYILGIVNGTNSAGAFASSLDFIGKHISTIIGVVGKAIASFIAFQTIMKTIAVFDLIKASGGIGEFVKGMFSLKKSTDEATESQKKLSGALKGIAWTVLIAFAYELGKKMFDLAFGYQQARERLEEYNKEIEKGTKRAEKNILTMSKNSEESIRKLELEQRQRIANGEKEKDVLKDVNSQKKRIYENESVLSRKRAEIEQKEIEKRKQQSELAIKLAGNQSRAIRKGGIEGGKEARIAQNQLEDLANQVGINIGRFDDYLDIKEKIITKTEAFTKSSKVEKQMYEDRKIAIEKTLEELQVETLELDKNTTSTKTNEDSKKKFNTTLKANNTDLKYSLELKTKIAEIDAEISALENERKQEKNSTKYEKELEAKKKQAQEFGNADVSVLNDLIDEEAKLKKDALDSEKNIKIKSLDERLKDEKNILIEDLDRQKAELLKQEGLSVEARRKINDNYRIELAKINQLMIEEEKLVNKEKEKIETEYAINSEKLQEDKKKKNDKTNEEILNAQKEYIDKLRELESATNEEKTIKLDKSIEDQKKIIEKSVDFQKRVELEALKELMIARYNLRKKEIEAEYDLQLSKVEKGSVQEKLLMQQKNNALLKLRLDFQKDVDDIDKTILENQKENWKSFLSEVRKVFSQILDRIEQTAQKEVKASEDKISKQEKMVDIQRQRAEQGLTNTLAFEQKELAKAESQKLKAEKKLLRAQEIKALYSSYAGYAGAGDKNALSHTLKDFAIMKAISLAFGDGGVVEDRLPGNGIFQGQSHSGNAGGIPILVEGSEGIFSKSEMKNLGKDNFYALKSLAGRGRINEGFFGNETKAFIQAVPMVDNGLKNEVIEMRKAIQNMETNKFDIVNYTKDLFKIIETTQKGNSIIRNTYEVKKPRL